MVSQLWPDRAIRSARLAETVAICVCVACVGVWARRNGLGRRAVHRVATADCGSCGDIEVDARDVLLGPGPSGGSKLVLRLVCPTCLVLLMRPVDALTVCTLLTAGARWDGWEWPQELAEHPGDESPLITQQDVIEFVKALSLLPVAPDPSE